MVAVFKKGRLPAVVALGDVVRKVRNDKPGDTGHDGMAVMGMRFGKLSP